MQTSLMEGIDGWAFASMIHPENSNKAGNLLLVGAPPEMLHNRHAPLFQRITTTAICE